MIPRNVSRHIILTSCLALLALGPARTENALATNQGTSSYCASDIDGPVIYFSGIFDTNTNARLVDTQPLANAFNDFLKAMYDYKTNSNYPAGCPIFDTVSQAEVSKRQLETQARQAKKEVVEVDWKPASGVESLQSAQGHNLTAMPKAPRLPRYTLCLSQLYENTVYLSAAFDTTASPNGGPWTSAFTQFLTRQYSFKGRVDCYTLGQADAERVLRVRVDATRAASRKAVETNWKYDPTTAALNTSAPKPTPDDDDPEPPQHRAAAANPSADISDFATKEVPVVLARCQNDRDLSGAFNCFCVQRTLYDYRMKHATEDGPGVQPEPLPALMAGNKLDCSTCISAYVKMWARSAAQSRGLQPAAADCVSERFETALHAKPYPNHITELFNGTIAACKK